MKTQKYSPFKWGWIIALVLISGLVLFGTARADVTGWKTAGAIVASGSWSNFTLNQINTSNNARATVATINSYGVCSNYQFNIPTGSTINGLEVRVEGSSSTTGTVNYAVQLSWDLGITWTAAKTNSFTGTTDANQTLGGTTDTWARSWTAAELSNPLFQFRIYKTGGANLRVDLIQIQVHFTPPLVSLADHLAGQKENAFLNAGLLSGAELLAFQLTNNSGSIINLTQVLFQLSTISGINQGDLSNLLIYVDENANGVVDGGETAMVGGSGSVDSGVTAITFSSPFTLAANSVTYFILKGDVANLNANDRLAIRLESTGLTVSGGTAGGSTEAVNHQLYDFVYRRPVTVNAPQRGAACGTSYSLAHFPVLISLSGDWLKTIGNGGRIQHGSGYDILFKAADGRTKLDHELEAYDGTAGTLLAWVRVPALFQNNQDTLIYVYYGSATMAAPTENPAGVWSDGYSGIWHLAQDPGPGGQGDITDSTRFGNHGTAEASMSSGNLVDGKIGRGIRFDGVDDGIWFPDPHDGGSLTLSAWINASALNNSWHTVAQRDNSNNSWFDWQLYARADDAPTPLHATFRVDLDNDGTYTEQAQSDIALATDTWYFLTATYDGSDFKFYRDGVLTDTYLQTGSFPDSNRAMWLGRNAIWNEPFQGIIDEFRVSTVARDDCWVGTEFNNQNAPGNFLTPGNEETGPFLTGTVYEDRNYGGGSGRSLSESQGTGRPNVRVELYDGSGNYLTATTTNGSGVYTFSSLAAGTYIVRVVNNTVGSGRSGGCVSPPTGCSQIPVQVFGTNAISGIAIPVTDHVGGEVPGKADAGNGSTTLTDLNTPTTTAQSITTVTFSTTDVLGIDFGFNFNTVVNTNDTGQGSLRQFLTNANALSNAGLSQAGRTAGIDNAVFMLADGTARPGMNIGYGSMFSGGLATISPASVLPAVMDPIIIDGTTQPTWVNSPIIELNGSGAGASWVGLCLLGGNSTVKGLVINRFSTGVGIYIGAVGDNQILGNYIGTNAAGTAAASNGTGIQVDDVGPTTIGGDSPGAGNLISGNSGSGIEVSGSASTGLRVMGNKIGINFAGSAFIPNGGHGVFISDTGPVQNTIGGTAAGAGNLIAGNTGNGVTITGTTSGNALLGNSLYGNGGLGIDLNNDNITLNDAGDPDTGGNDLQNFPVLTNASTGSGLLTLAGFLQSMANTGFRIEFFANSSPDPGGYGEGERYLGATNVTTDGAGNTVIALTLVASVAAGEFISSTATRLDAGLQPVETSEFSLSVAATAGTLTVTNTNDTINGDTSSVATLIASPGADGISLREAITAANNTLGTDTIRFNIAGGGVKTIAPASALPSIDDPVVIDGYSQPGASVNTLAQGSNATLLIVINGASAGGSTFGLIINAGSSTIRGLVINDFSYAGLALNAGNGNLILGNYVGTNAAGTLAVPNGRGTGWDGIVVGDVSPSSINVLGGASPADRNLISGNNGGGIWMVSSNGGNTIRGNYIGVNSQGSAAIGNLQHGIILSGSGNTIIGNVISGNGGSGYYGLYVPSGSDQTVIQGNIIGRSADETSAIPNNNHAVFLASSNNSVGGISAGQGNLIASNTGKGVVVLNGGTGNAILGNSIYGNTSIGIDLSNNGVSANNGTKSGSTANYGMDYPVFTSVTLNGNTLTVGGYVGSAPNQSLFANARLEIFKSDNDGSGYGEGQTYLGSLNTDANGNFSGSLSVNGLAAGDRLTGTATDGSNNTSEFGPSNIPVILYYTLSGRVYTDEGATPVGAGKTVRLLINGTSLGTGVTDGSGDYSISAPYTSGQAALVYIDDDAVYKGVTASVLNASSLSGFYIYASHVITRQDNGGVLSNANLGSAKGSYADTDILYSVSGSDLTLSGSGITLYLPPGQSYQPGGNITTPALKSLGTFSGGSGTIDVNGALSISGGTFTASTGTTYVAGNLNISGGTFTHNSGTFVFDGSNDSTVSAASATFNNITVSKGPTVPPNPVKLTLTGNLTLNGALTIDTGMLDQGGASNLRAGSVAINEGGILWNRGTGSLTLAGAVTNNGEVNFNGGGDGTTCGSAAKIQIRSSVDGTQRSWSGSGIFGLVDLDVKDQAGTASLTAYGSTDSGNNGANWIIMADCTGAPTAVSLVSFSAIRHSGKILLRWLTGYEVNNLGFHVYREDGGNLHRLTPELVAGSALRAGSGVGLRGGRPYMWLDSSIAGAQESEARYWLEDVDLNGKRTWYGPVSPVVSSEPLPERFTSELLSSLGQQAAKKQEISGKIRLLKERLPDRRSVPIGRLVKTQSAPGANLSLNRSPQTEMALQWALAAGPAVKIPIKEEGWYRIRIGDLWAAGLNTGAKPRNLKLFAEGKEVPLLVKSKKAGRFGAEDTIEFYAAGLDTPSTDTRVYWLKNGSRPGKRLPQYGVQEGRPALASFPFTVELKERLFFFANLKNGEKENFFGAVVAAQPVNKFLTVPLPDPAPSGEALLEVALQGVTQGPHRVKVLLNQVEVGEVAFEGQTSGTGHWSFSQDLLLEGENLVTLTAQNGEMDVSLIDSLRLTYWHVYKADANTLRFSAEGGWEVSVDGFSNPDIRVMDITDPLAPYEVQGTVFAQGADYSFAFGVPGAGRRTLLAFTEEQIKRPLGIAANQPSSWHEERNAYDYVILSHRDFLPALEPLKNLRQTQRLSTAIIDVEDIYDEFSFGNKTPQAIKDFLIRAQTEWSRSPRFLLLVGDASMDPRNYLGQGNWDYVPTKLVETAYLETASDDWFADFGGDGLPKMALGRLPVRTVEEASTVVAKIVGYEQVQNAGGWTNQVLLVADENKGFDFEAASAAVRILLPKDLVVREIFRGRYGADEQANEELLRAFDQGALLVNYIGHGSEEVWGVDLLRSDECETFTNGSYLPFVIAMTCLNGHFHDVYTESLAEAFLKAKQGGAVAVWASSGLTQPGEQAVLNRELIRLLVNGKSPTLGEAVGHAKAAINNPDIRRTWILFGDPAMRLRLKK